MDNTFDKKAAIDRTKKADEHADLKQHADKIIQGLEKLDDHQAKRAIWELFQNAIDLSDHCIIKIDLNEQEFVFSHNGKPFTTETLICLIKQVSSKSAENNDEEVGQYGTGFLSTHSFGKKILLSGCLEESNSFIPFKSFEIDRSCLKSEEMITKIREQRENVYKLLDKQLQEEIIDFTDFAYQFKNQLEKKYAQKSLDDLELILPYVMIFNPKLQEVQVYENSRLLKYYKRGRTIERDGILSTEIYLNETKRSIYHLKSEDETIDIIIPLADNNKAVIFNKELSKLFLYYPLIGTENFGINFIIHCKDFSPKEQRDAIHLNSNNEAVSQKEESNRIIIHRASEIIFNFIDNQLDKITDRINLSVIEFITNSDNDYLNEYFIELREKWVSQFKELELLETGTDRIKPVDALFLDESLLMDVEYDVAIYNVLKQFYTNIPDKSIIRRWSEIIENWNSDLERISITDIAQQIENLESLDNLNDVEALKKFYEYLIGYNQISIFDHYKLLPNIKNELREKTNLNLAPAIDKPLIKVADILIPDTPKKFIKSDFKYNLDIPKYDRKQFSKEISARLTQIGDDLKIKSNKIGNEELEALISFCNIFPSIENTGNRGKLMPTICNYYNFSPEIINITLNEDREIDWRPAIKLLTRIFLSDLNQESPEWISDNIEMLYNLLNIIHHADDFREIVETVPIFPNQQFVLCKQSDLKIDANIPNKLKDLYDEIFSNDNSIRSALVLNNFGQFLKKKEYKTPKQVADEIDTCFKDDRDYEKINDHKYQNYILNIIQWISDDEEWAKYFPGIDDKKALILLARIQDKETKKDMFSIIGLDKKRISILGELSKSKDLERIIQLGKIALEEERRNNADFQFKHAIGTHIEKIIREKLGKELEGLKIDVSDEQGGQDIIIKFNDNVLYSIEVKSRWDVRNSITMSQLQMKNSVNVKEKYALCCVDMSDYLVGDSERYEVKDIDQIMERINVLNDIGYKFEPIVDGVFSKMDIENEISLTGDLRGIIPQTIVKDGLPFTDFLNDLTKLLLTNLELKYAKPNQ